MVRVLKIAFIVVAIGLPIAMAMAIVSTAIDIPFWDEWEWVDLIYRSHIGSLQFADLWASHSEHRMLFPQLLVLALDALGGWSQVREQMLSLVFLIVTEIGILALVRRTFRGSSASLVGIAACIILFGLWQDENLTWGFQTAWFVCNAAVVWVILSLTRSRRQPIDVFWAIVLAIIASFSSSQGLVTWVVGAIAIIAVPRSPIRALFVWVPAAIVTYVAYRGSGLPVTDGHLSLLAHPVEGMRYVLAYLGSPIGWWRGAAGSEMFGLLVLLALIASLSSDAFRSNRLARFVTHGPWYALASYPVCCAFATASGRGGYGIDQALSSRYTTISGLLWIGVIALAVSQINALKRPAWRWNVLAAALAMLLVFVARSESTGWSAWVQFDARLVAARAGLEHGDRSALSKLYPDEQRIEMLIDDLRRVHDGIFAPS